MARLSVLLSLALLATFASSVPQTKPLRGTPISPRENTSTTVTAALKLPSTTAASVVLNGTSATGDDEDDSPHGTAATTSTTVLPLVSNGTTIGNVSLVEATTITAPPLNGTTVAEENATTTTSPTTSDTSSKPVVATTDAGFWKRLSWGHITLIVLGAAAALLMISCLMSCLVFGEGAFYLVSCGPCRKR